MKKKSLPLATGLSATAIILLSSGCVVGPEDSPNREDNSQGDPSSASTASPTGPDNSGQEVIASSTTSSTAIGEDYQIDIYALENVGNNLLRLQIGVTNKSSSDYFLQDGLSDHENPYTANRITLLDPKNQTRHLSFNRTNGTCFCSELNENIPAGESAEMWVVFPHPPAGVESMTVTTPLTPPIFDVPISNSSETLENPGLADPEIIPMTMISDSTEDNTGRSESGDEVSIILSSDVLFETNSSELNPEAQDIIDQVATEINDANSTVVNIDGHADNTGSDSVNIPLSQERAEAVESALSGIVSREGVTFESEGHGSADPIGDNATQEGRERNRRVTVTFEK